MSRDREWNRYSPRFRRLWLRARFEITPLGRVALEAAERETVDLAVRRQAQDLDDDLA
jgi:hypothetical protein